MKPFLVRVGKSIQVAILILVACFVVGCDDGHPSHGAYSNAKELRQYLQRGGNPNGMTKQDWYKGRRTLLHQAAIYGDEEIVSMLLAAGANPNGGDSGRETPLMAVLRSREQKPSRFGVIKCLLKVSDLAAKDEYGMTAYDFAMKYGSTDESELVREALETRPKEENKNP